MSRYSAGNLDTFRTHQCTATCFAALISDNQERDRCVRALDGILDLFTDKLFVTGGLALNWHLSHGRRDLCTYRACFNDIDLVIESSGSLPAKLPARYLVSHYHPGVPPGKLVIQLADVDTQSRIDVFTLKTATVASRCATAWLGTREISVISVEDLSIQFIQHLWRVFCDKAAEPKYLEKLEQALPLVDPEVFQDAWNEVKLAEQPKHPLDAVKKIQDYVNRNGNCLQEVRYSQDLKSMCPNCVDSYQYPLSEKQRLFDLWGYV